MRLSHAIMWWLRFRAPSTFMIGLASNIELRIDGWLSHIQNMLPAELLEGVEFVIEEEGLP